MPPTITEKWTIQTKHKSQQITSHFIKCYCIQEYNNLKMNVNRQMTGNVFNYLYNFRAKFSCISNQSWSVCWYLFKCLPPWIMLKQTMLDSVRQFRVKPTKITSTLNKLLYYLAHMNAINFTYNLTQMSCVYRRDPDSQKDLEKYADGHRRVKYARKVARPISMSHKS